MVLIQSIKIMFVDVNSSFDLVKWCYSTLDLILHQRKKSNENEMLTVVTCTLTGLVN